MADQRITQAAVITDPTTTTQQAGVDASGNLKVIAAAGNNNIGDVDIASIAAGDNTIGRVKITDGTDVVLVSAAGAMSVDVGNTVTVTGTVTVTATDLDVRDLTKASDSVATWTNTAKDGTGTAYQPIVDTDGHLQVDVLTGGAGPAPTNPAYDITNVTTPVTIAAGASGNLDSADLASKKLRQAVVTGSVPFKVILATLANGTATNKVVLFGGPDAPVIYEPPHPDFFVSGSSVGADGFRAAVTNLDPSDSADFYASYAYQD